ncbi:hypothetical protein Anas_11467 [Armadillidium nasatum]|uniref:Uncharacterized protein n=1 Tax=Armadillidium nasatum TaxID=96803 RepID=A0A5N5TBI7_9CRUS|nr:hypothetical protein Anas_11467 [Armadillidium nasatum]
MHLLPLYIPVPDILQTNFIGFKKKKKRILSCGKKMNYNFTTKFLRIKHKPNLTVLRSKTFTKFEKAKDESELPERYITYPYMHM